MRCSLDFPHDKVYGPGPSHDRRTPDTEGIELTRLAKALWRRRVLIASATLLGAVLFFLAMSQVTPLYTARASLMLDPRSVQVLSSDSVVSDLTLNNAVLDTEAAVLRSNLLLEDVVRGLGPDALAPLDPALQTPGLLDVAKSAVRTVLGSVAGSQPAPPQPGLNPEDRQTRRLIAALRQAVTVRRDGQSYLIVVAVETPTPGLSSQIANQLVERYIARQIEQRDAVIRNATAFLDERVEDMRWLVEEAEQRIEDFRTRQLAQSGATADTVDRQVLELSTQLALAEADLAQVEARAERVDSLLEEQGLDRGAALLDSPFVLSLRQRLSEVRRRDADLATRYSDDFPDRLAAQAEMTQLNADLQDAVRQIRTNLRDDVTVAAARVAAVRERLAEAETRAAALSRANLDLRQMEREADALRANYQDTLGRLSETRATQFLQRADARPVERAVPPGAPSSPRVMLFTMFGATLGFAVGVLASFWLAMRRVGFTTPREIENSLHRPVIASLLRLPAAGGQTLLDAIRDAPYALVTERLRQVRTVLAAGQQIEPGGMVVQVASALPDEGKTATTLALASLEGLAKRRCLVLDFDLRRSDLAKRLTYAAPSDLADVLLQDAPLEDAIWPVRDHGFDLITLKAPAPDLVNRLDPARLNTLITSLRGAYDLVLIDSAPLLLVSDALRLAPLADRVLYLIRQDSTNKKAVEQALRMLDEMGGAPVALALSLTDPESEEDTYGVYANTAYG